MESVSPAADPIRGDGRANLDGRVLVGLLILNLLVHFIPFERPGFQPDDFANLAMSRTGTGAELAERGLTQGTRPLATTINMFVPYLFGLDEGRQLGILLITTSVYTALVYAYLTGAFARSVATLAALAAVLWPVKHEIYASQLFATINIATCLILASGLAFRRWSKTGSLVALLGALALYCVSIFIYELGYLAPLVFYLVERERMPTERRRGVFLFLLPAAFYWIVRLSQPVVDVTMGRHDSAALTIWRGLASLPSNLVGFQLVRNVAYGMFAAWSAPSWFLLTSLLTTATVAVLAGRGIEATPRTRDRASLYRVGLAGLLSAVLLSAPAAAVLVESRHSSLAAIAMGVVVASLAVRGGKLIGTTMLVVLCIASEGLALRQAEASRIQSSVHRVLVERRDELGRATSVVFDVPSLASRINYTWGDRETNVLRSYWGIYTLSQGGFSYMLADVLNGNELRRKPKVVTCIGPITVSDTTITCARKEGTGKETTVEVKDAVVVDFNSLPLPSSILLSRSR